MPTFINASMLLGTLLVGIPIVLHLIMRQQPQHLIFPALQFVQQRKEANQRRLKLRHLLLLLLRCAAILLIAVALARPLFQLDDLPAGNAPVAAAVVFDTSPRMDYRDQNQSRLDVAQEAGQWLLKQFPKESDLVVLDSVTPRADFDIDRGAATLRVEQLHVDAAARPLLETIENAQRVVAKSDKAQKEIFVFTDLSLAAWNPSQLKQLKRRLEQQPEIHLHLFDVGVLNPRNLTVGDLNLSSQSVASGGTADVSFDVLSSGSLEDSPNESRFAELFLATDGGPPTRRAQESIVVSPESGAFVSLRLSLPPEAGVYQGYVQLDRSDNLAIDDVRYFTVEAKPAWRVLLVAPSPPERYTRLLNDALAPFEYRQRGLAQFQCDVVSQADLATQALRPYQAIWLLDPEPLSRGTWQRLARYVSEGGSLAIALGRNAAELERFNLDGPQPLLPAKLVGQWRAGDRQLRLAPANLEHPILARFKPVASSVPWDLNPILKFWRLGPLREGAEVILAYDNGQPALVEQSVGRGIVLTLTTPVSDSLNDRRAWNNLLAPLREAWPGFLLVVEMTHYLIGNSRTELNYQVGDAAEVRLDSGSEFEQFLLTSPSGDTSRIAVDRRDRSLRVVDTHEAGQYELRAGGAEGTRLGFSVNLPAAVTQLERIGTETLSEALGDAMPSISRDRDTLLRSRQEVRGKGAWEAYPWLMLIVVFVMAGEQLVSTLFYRRHATAGGN
ncbi:MAG: hypothetical protein DWQ35_17420 [Planctomycetota bacterium]|nr:MAG: hypothetical protein DWQ35_17420 [Planctomycetota bacterium]REK28229.1 MAG: hypothetical protein DWQ42_05805 [Planctomycetota bacterium]REK39759.1 MAG: hypothetical protein DWQ46_17760 [Planctomycetota bacterium]